MHNHNPFSIRSRAVATGLLFFLFLFAVSSPSLSAEPSPLQPVRTDTPRDTMETFMDAMNDYRRGVENRDPTLRTRLDAAVRTLNLQETPYVVRKQKGRDAAIYLKEVIDRILDIDLDRIPDSNTNEDGETLHRWRLKDTEIVISRVETGERAGEYLFSPSTVERAEEFYEKVRHLDYVVEDGGAHYREPFIEKLVPEWAKNNEFFYLQIWQWIGILFTILAGLIVRTLIRFTGTMLLKLLERIRAERIHFVVDVAHGPADLLGAALAWYMLSRALHLEGNALAIVHVALQVITYGALIWLAYRLIGHISEVLYRVAAKTESTLDDQLVPLLNRSIRIFTVILGTLVAIQNMGINVLSLLAGLGIGGIAFALAARDTVANFFGSIMILFDSPFQVGDWIKLGELEGTVEEIGFRSTRIRTFYNSQVTVPNSDLMNARIDNLGRREYRRILAYFGLTYDTPSDKMEAFIEGLKEIVRHHPHTRKDYFHVVFNDYGTSSLNVMLYCFLKVPDWSTELVERQNIYMDVLKLAEQVGVRFAFPTQTVHLETQNPPGV